MFFTLLLSIYSVVVQGLVLPGKCPSVPATNFQWTDYSQILHRLSVHLNSHKSHIFNSYFTPFSSTHFIYVKSEGIYRLSRRSIQLESYVQGNISMSSNPNGSNQMTSDILVDEISNVLCQDTITEEVRLWRDNNTLIIWSCVDIGNGTEHDEAALVFEFYENSMESYRETPDLLDVLKAMNVSVRKYLSDTFVEAIDWSQGSTFNLTSGSDLHLTDECLSKQSAVKALRKSLKKSDKTPEMTSATSYYWITIAIFPIVFLAFICTELWFNREEDSPTRRVVRIQVLEMA